ncbi:MAG: sensor histidine kinase N-terminal domain-containing protein, partial [Rhodoferax sp.]
MKTPAPHSLRTRLLWWLLVAILLTVMAQASIAYRTARAEADDIFDYHMQQMAMSLRLALPLNAEGTGMDEPRMGENADFVVQVWNANGARVFQSAPRAVLPDRGAPGFSNLKVQGRTYRVFSMQTESQTIQIAQDMAARREMASTLALRTVAPIAVMAPLLMLVAWWVV